MNILSICGQIVDLDQVRVTTLEPEFVCLTFGNGDKVVLPWRDESEKRDILRSLEVVPGKS